MILRWTLLVSLFSISFLSAEDIHTKEQDIVRQLQMLNQISEEQLSEKNDPAFSILKKLYDLDSPDFLTLRKLLGQAEGPFLLRNRDSG